VQRLITFVYPIIRTDYIKKSVESLYKYTDNSKFNVIVVDQSINGLDKEWTDKYVHLYIRMKNQGFSKAANEGVVHALRWQVPYICVANCDTEFIYQGWLEDALEEFKTDEKILAVCPESPRVPMWGYGLTEGEQVDILPYKEEYTKEDIEYLKKGDYNKDEIQGRYTFKIPESFPFTKRGVIDGIAMWLPIFKRESFIEVGMFDERFVWGGGEDYDMLARAYSCAWPIERDTCDERYHKRMVSTMRSWVWHWWGQSKDSKGELDPALFESKEPWNNLGDLYPPVLNGGFNVDPWGHWKDESGIRHPFKRIPSIKCDPL
jgi:GT2 family glycosyltransferase